MSKYRLRNLESNSGSYSSVFIGELVESLSYYLSEKNISTNIAHKIANEVVDDLRANFGGCQIYLPKIYKKKTVARDMEIYTKYTQGAFVNELAVEYGVSLQAIYGVIRRVREKVNKEPDTTI